MSERERMRERPEKREYERIREIRKRKKKEKDKARDVRDKSVREKGRGEGDETIFHLGENTRHNERAFARNAFRRLELRPFQQPKHRRDSVDPPTFVVVSRLGLLVPLSFATFPRRRSYLPLAAETLATRARVTD